MRKRTPTVHSRFESAPQPGNLSNKITTSLDRQFNWPLAYALTRNRNKSLYRTQSLSYASAKDSSSKTWAKSLSRASVTQSAPMPRHGSSESDRLYLQLIADFSGRILIRRKSVKSLLLTSILAFSALSAAVAAD